MKRSAVPDLKIDDTLRRCWVADDGCYVWLALDGSLLAGRSGKNYWARHEHTVIRNDFHKLIDAMRAATWARAAA